MAGSCVLPIDSERALCTAGVFSIFVADLDRRPRSPTLLRVLPPRRAKCQMCAVCRFPDVPVLWPVSRLTQHAPVARVHVPCVVVPSEPTLAHRAAREARLVPLLHDERCVRRGCCTSDKQREL